MHRGVYSHTHTHTHLSYRCSFTSRARPLMVSAVSAQTSVRQGKERTASRRRRSPNSLITAGRRHRKSRKSASCWVSVQRASRTWKSWWLWPTTSKPPGKRRSGTGQEKKKAESRKSTTWWRRNSVERETAHSKMSHFPSFLSLCVSARQFQR